jgi:DNA processing protein
VVQKLVSGLATYPITIVSGLAIGIDALSHEAALANNLHTIAVPGSGISDPVLYPSIHRRLAHRILQSGGALVSEFEPDFRATTWSFPQRNRIMAGMSHAVLIIEARERSGTLITARLAMEYNRDVLTVPGSIFGTGSVGPHGLIRTGATPVTCVDDILEALHIRPKEQKIEELPSVDAEERALLILLESPCAKDELIRRSQKPAHEASVIITMLELKGYVQEHDGIIMRTVAL